MIFWVVYQSFYFSYTHKPQLRPRPGQAKPKLSSFGLASSIYKPRPMKARPKLGLSGQAQAGTSLIVSYFGTANKILSLRLQFRDNITSGVVHMKISMNI